MTKPFQPTPAPDAQPRDEARTRCARSCCWSPYGHAPRTGCKCHTPVEAMQ